ncbi:MAG: ATP-binding cassette domain-containing protein [Candidatus Thermoplasmatota archaeon]
MACPQYAIQTQNLTKRFGDLIAVNDVSLSVACGEIFGLLGPNGAGKTTLISILATLLAPTEGSALVWSYDVVRAPAAVRSSIGIVFQDPALDDNLTGAENMWFHARLYKMPEEEIDRRVAEMLRLVGLYARKDDLVKTYSGGMRRRLELARGLLHRPKVLFLDEPTLGLDPQTRRLIWDYIKSLKAHEQVTILLTTHYMDEADVLCDRVAIIDYGRFVALDTPAKLKDALGGDVLTLTLRSVDGGAAGRFVTVLQQLDGVVSVSQQKDHFIATVRHGEEMIPRIIEAAR